MIALLLLKQIAALFLIMGMGFLTVKKGLMKSEDSQILSVISIYIITPALIINAFQVDYTPDIRDGFLLASGIAILVHCILLLSTRLLQNVFNLSIVERASVIYSNAGNLIFPLVMGVLGPEWVIYASAYLMVQLVFLWTQGISMMSGKRAFNWRSIVTNLNLISIVIGAILFFTNIRLPEVVASAFSGLSATIGPISMLLLGMIIAGVDYGRDLLDWPTLKVLLLKMLFFPMISMLILKYSGLANLVVNGDKILTISLLACSAPSATMVMQLSQIYDLDVAHAGKINLLTTLACIVTIPFMVLLYQL